MTTLVKQAIMGAAAVISRRIATMLARRRMTVSSIRSAAQEFVLPQNLGKASGYFMTLTGTPSGNFTSN